jgi:ribosomal protein S6--L-glutamate ligase
MKVLVISQNSQLYSTSRLLQEATALNIPIGQMNIYESGTWSEGQKCTSTVVFNRFSGVKYDDFDLQLASSWADQGSLILNPVDDTRIFRDKLSSHIFLSNLELPMPETKAIRGKLSRDRIDDVLNFNNHEDIFEEEYLIKPTRGNQGHGISLCRGRDALLSQLESYFYLQDQRYIIQPRLKIKREYRLFFIGQEIFASFEKHQKDTLDFRLNASRSECYKIIPNELSKELLSFFQIIKRNTRLFYGGIDIAETDKGLYLLEVNPCPGFEVLENVCEVNVARELLLQVQNSLSN